jgi:ABC-type lipopolysaccharide export system ATPase subunit
MSEKILKALMQLFAIIANLDREESSRGRDLVKQYLKHYLSSETIEEFLKLYDEYYNIHHKKSGRKGISANSVKVLRICEEVNSELKREQKILVLLQLLEFITYGKGVTDIELEFVQTVAEIFNISQDEFNNAKEFMFGHYDDIPNKKHLLIIDGDANYQGEIKHIYRPKLEGAIYVLYIPSSDTYMFKYTGQQSLKLNGQPIKPNWGYVFDKGSSIRGSLISPIYYSDVSGLFLQGSVPYKLVFTAKDIEFRFKNSTNGIHKFTFSEETGKLVGIMGGSGAGKSTLLNIFNGKYKPLAGSITINGYDIHKDKDKLKGVIGFVPQDDLLIEELTVYQNLYYNAKLVFDGLTEEEINEGRRYTVDELKLLFCIEPDNNGYWTVSFLERRKNCRLIGRFTEYDRDYFILDLPVDAYGKIQGNIDECSFTKFEVIPRDGKKTDFDQKRIEKSTKTFGSMKIFIPEARALTETKNKVIDEINVKRVYPSKARVWPIEKNSDKESATFSYWIMIPVKRITIEVKVKNDNPKRYKVLEPVVIDWEDRDFGEEIKKSPESIKKGEEGDTVGRWVLTPTKSNRFYIGSKLKVTVERERLP